METTTMSQQPRRSASGAVDVEYYLQRARRLRADALRQMTQALGAGLARLVERAHEAVRIYRRRRAAYHELVALDAQALRDIGIAHADIESIANGSFASDPSRCRGPVSLPPAKSVPALPWVRRERPGIRQAACCG